MLPRLLKKQKRLLFLLPFGFLAFFVISSPLVGFTNQLFTKISSNPQLECKDWNDYEFIANELKRSGLGEQGEPVFLTDAAEIVLNEKLYNKTGFSVVVSDKISVNRSVTDFRNPGCISLKYLAKLPKVSVIIIFYNEVKSILLRTVHSVMNRTPPELLHEIILVNDCSTENELYEPLQQYVDENFRGKVKIKNLTKRTGLIVTRLEGARIATGEVLVFFDSHVEVSTNWLPPLLDPIARNRRIATVPIIDDFDSSDFGTYRLNDVGERAGFDWSLIYRHFERYLPEGIDSLRPFPNPIMLGCAFAIDRKFFLEELGGYDEEFQVWNGENYELSFKLWLCADGLFEVPCSRVLHTFRMINPSRNSDKGDYVARNFKRLAEVWMGDYKNLVYGIDPSRYEKVDAGNLEEVKAIRDRLNCKPFSYFLDEIAPDLRKRFPTTRELPSFASGQLRSLGSNQQYCVDSYSRDEFTPIGLYECAPLDFTGKPPQTQFFRLDFNKNLVYGYMVLCLDSWNMAMPQCSFMPYGNQYWRFLKDNKMLVNGVDEGKSCLTAHHVNLTMSLMPCDEEDSNQKWTFTYINETALDDWKNIDGYKIFSYGDKPINYDKMLPVKYDHC
jgi:polypeptide N-acetylgalactosaminyltransferase